MARLVFEPELVKLLPPWLRRTVADRLVRGLAKEIDELVEKLRAGAKARFPGWDEDDIDPEALATIGRERRILRGPREPADVYAGRLRMWWDAHRGRGGPYALLAQLDAFFEWFLNVRMDVVYANGVRYSINTATPGVITRDEIVWNGDGSGKWARFWVFFYVPATISSLSGDTLITQDGDTLITQDGDTLITDATISPDELGAEEEELFRAIPREWSAAHIDRAEVVLLWDARRLWDYPQPIPTWNAWAATSTWGQPPTVLPITWS